MRAESMRITAYLVCKGCGVRTDHTRAELCDQCSAEDEQLARLEAAVRFFRHQVQDRRVQVKFWRGLEVGGETHREEGDVDG